MAGTPAPVGTVATKDNPAGAGPVRANEYSLEGVISHEEVLWNSLERPVDTVTNLYFIAYGLLSFGALAIPFLAFVFGCAKCLKRIG